MKKNALAVGLVAALVAAGNGAAATAKQQVIHLKLPGTRSAYVDLGPKGYSPGDYFLSTGKVLDGHGRKVGRLGGVWTLLSPAADDAAFDLGLTGGTIMVHGRIRHTAKTSVLTVADGTGAYAGARGTAVFRYTSDTTASLDIHLR